MEKEVIRHKQRVNNFNIQVNQPVMMNLFRILMRCHYNHFFSCFLFDSLSLSSHYIFSLRALDFDNCWLSMTVVVGGGWSALTLAFPSCLLAIAFHFVNHVSTPKY